MRRYKRESSVFNRCLKIINRVYFCTRTAHHNYPCQCQDENGNVLATGRGIEVKS